MASWRSTSGLSFSKRSKKVLVRQAAPDLSPAEALVVVFLEPCQAETGSLQEELRFPKVRQQLRDLRLLFLHVAAAVFLFRLPPGQEVPFLIQ